MKQHRHWWESIGLILGILALILVARTLLKAQPPAVSELAESPTTAATVVQPSPISEATATPTATPTQGPTATAAPQITSMQDAVTVGGYTFSYPQEVPDGHGPVNIVGWLPGSPDEIVDTRDGQVKTIDVYTGKIREFSPVFTMEEAPYPAGVRLLQDDRIAFYVYNPQMQRNSDLWISGDGDKLATEPVFRELGYSAILAPDSRSLILYNRETLETRVFGQTQSAATQAMEHDLVEVLSALPLHHEPEEIEQGVDYRNTPSPAGRWMAFDHEELVILADLETGGTQQFVLGDHLWATTLRWSPDGQRLALLVTEGQWGSIPYQKLLVLDSTAMELREIKTDFRYVIDLAWSPDSQNLLISVHLGKTAQALAGFEYEVDGLFLASIASGKIQQVPILPENTGLKFDWGISWAPDGSKIALSARFALAESPQLYRIDVSNP